MEDPWQAQEPNLNDKISFKTVENQNDCSDIDEDLKPYECELCNSRFGSKNYLRVHISSVHQKKSVVQCTICDKFLSNDLTLKGHIASVHEGKKPFKCKICGTSFAIN